jgi:hypothetical protein
MFPSFNFLQLSVIFIVILLWAWAVVDLLKKEISGAELTKWFVIILVMPVIGFLLYFWLGRKKYKVKQKN